MPENSTLGLTRRGLETGPWRTHAGTKLETADTAKGSLPEPRQSSTLLLGGGDGNVGIIRSPVRAIALPDCDRP